jgi:general secretion pathway protein C
VLLALLLLGFVGGAGLNQAAARFLALPEGTEKPEYVDVATPEAGGAPPEGGMPGERPRPAPRGLGVHVPGTQQYVDAIVKRNIFDSSAVYNPQVATSGDGTCKGEGKVKLLATVVVEPTEFSSALIADGSSAGAYALGDDVSGEGRIVTIEQNKVCLDGGSCICIGADSARPTADEGEAGGGDVEKLGENKYRVDPSVLAEAMGNFETLATQLRVTPHKGTDGKVDGFRVSAIRRNSLFDKLGLKNGDIIHTVNGQALTSAEGAMSTYQTLQSERAFTFEVTRRNQKQTLEYEVR